MGSHLDQTPSEILGERVDTFISKQLTLEGGGNPKARAVRLLLMKCKSTAYVPGKFPENRGGRKRTYTEHQEEEAARVAMTLKAQRRRVCPSLVRATLPKKLVNPDTGKPMSDWKVRQIFQTRCYDEDADDPWEWLACASQDYLTEAMQAARLITGKYVLKHFAAGAWRNHAAIDPCSSLLPKAQARLEEQQVAAIGKKGWRSKGALRQGVNLRAPDTAKKQGGSTVLQVHWTPVFARGKVFSYVCNPTAAQHDATLPTKLNDSLNLAKFVQNVLPDILAKMKRAHNWSNLPRVVVHDKASYMVSSAGQRLNPVFASALCDASMRSWIGSANDSSAWLAGRLGDLYPHETAISHIRRLLAEKFICSRIGETEGQFRVRMQKVQDYMNSEAFKSGAGSGGGLESLAQHLRARCSEMVSLEGGRIAK